MVKLTSRQATLLENTRCRMEDWQIVKFYDDLSEKTKEELSLDDLIKALYQGYEIEEDTTCISISARNNIFKATLDAEINIGLAIKGKYYKDYQYIDLNKSEFLRLLNEFKKLEQTINNRK